MIDSHCHLDDPNFEFETAVGVSQNAGASGAVVPSYGPNRWTRQSEVLRRSSPEFRLWGGFGIHPWALESERSVPEYRSELSTGWSEHAERWESQLVAVGEFGLDRSPNRRKIPFELQQEVFRLHLDLAEKHRLPVILHLVKADGAAQKILQDRPLPAGGAIHGFSSRSETVPRYLEFGLAFGFGAGLMKFDKVRESLKATPLDRILFETDSHPELLSEIVIAASQILGKSVEYLRAQHSENCARVFGLV